MVVVSTKRPTGPCPANCPEPGPHIHRIGISKFDDEVLVNVDPNTHGPRVDVIREEGPDLTGLTAEQAFAVAGILLDGGHSDGPLVSLLMEANDLITGPQPRPRFGVLRGFFRRRRS